MMEKGLFSCSSQKIGSQERSMLSLHGLDKCSVSASTFILGFNKGYSFMAAIAFFLSVPYLITALF